MRAKETMMTLIPGCAFLSQIIGLKIAQFKALRNNLVRLHTIKPSVVLYCTWGINQPPLGFFWPDRRAFYSMRLQWIVCFCFAFHRLFEVNNYMMWYRFHVPIIFSTGGCFLCCAAFNKPTRNSGPFFLGGIAAGAMRQFIGPNNETFRLEVS